MKILLAGNGRVFQITGLTNSLELSVQIVILGQASGCIKPHAIASIDLENGRLDPLPFVGPSTTLIKSAGEKTFKTLVSGLIVPERVSLANIADTDIAIDISCTKLVNMDTVDLQQPTVLALV